MNDKDIGQFWMAQRKRRGHLNVGSTATEDTWDWSDCSEVIEFMAVSYAENDLIGWLGDEDLGSLSRPVIELVAEQELGLNHRFTLDYCGGTRSDLWQTVILWEGSRFIDRVCRATNDFAYLEARFGVDCQPRFAWGLSEIIYPIVLPIIKARVARGDLCASSVTKASKSA